MATHSSVLAWRIPGTAEPGGLLSMGLHRVGHDCSNLAAAQNKAGQRLTVLPREHTGHSKPPSNNTRDNSTYEHHQMVNTKIRLIIFFAAKNGDALYSQQKQDRELTGSDHELLIAKFRLNLRKVGKTTRPFRYDLNLIPYDYTVEVTNRFKGLDLIDRVPEDL